MRKLNDQGEKESQIRLIQLTQNKEATGLYKSPMVEWSSNNYGWVDQNDII